MSADGNEIYDKLINEIDESENTSGNKNNEILAPNMNLDNISLTEIDKNVIRIDKVGKSKPIKSRKNMSKYEFVGVITKLALYLDTLDSLDKYVDAVNIECFINNAELAYHLLNTGVFDAYINRLGYDGVSFSELRINPMWKISLENYFKRSHEALENTLFKPMNKLLEEK